MKNLNIEVRSAILMYLAIHGKIVEWNGKELGIYMDCEEGFMPVGYAVSDGNKIAGVANKLSLEEAIAEAEGMLKRARSQLSHPDRSFFPERFRLGLENSERFYAEIINCLAQV